MQLEGIDHLKIQIITSGIELYVSRNSVSLDFSQPDGPPQTVIGIVALAPLPFFFGLTIVSEVFPKFSFLLIDISKSFL